MLNLSFKLILLLVIWSYNCNNAVKKKITGLGISVVQACQSRLNIFPQRIFKPRIRKSMNHHKSNSGIERFAQNLSAGKKSRHNVRNCKSGRHNRYHTFKCRGSRYKPISTTFNITVWWLKEGRPVIPKLLLLVDEIGCFVLSIIVKIWQYVDIQNWNRPFCLSRNSTWTTMTYQWIQNKIIVPILISHFTMYLTKLIWIPIC